MEHMEHSTIHIKAPHHIHIGAKVKAAQTGTSMNQYIVNLITEDLGQQLLESAEEGIKLHKRVYKEVEDIKKLKAPEKFIPLEDSLLQHLPKPEKVKGGRCPHGFNLVVSTCKFGCKKWM